ncbi:MAG: CRISPR-associated endonuclease Cas2, partial [Ruminococcus sp.]
MKVIVFFDLPVSTKEKRKQYLQFSNTLIQSGSIIVHFLVFSWSVRNHDDAHKYSKIVKNILSPSGTV